MIIVNLRAFEWSIALATLAIIIIGYFTLWLIDTKPEYRCTFRVMCGALSGIAIIFVLVPIFLGIIGTQSPELGEFIQKYRARGFFGISVLCIIELIAFWMGWTIYQISDDEKRTNRAASLCGIALIASIATIFAETMFGV